MESNKKLKKLLMKAGLSRSEAELYIFILNNEGASLKEFYNTHDISKASTYRAYESLRQKGLTIEKGKDWKINPEASSLDLFIKKLENKYRSERHLVRELKLLNQAKKINCSSGTNAFVENYYEEDAIAKYIELSEWDFDHLLVFGNWEDFNDKKSLVKSEKKFIKNRVKKGADCTLFLTKGGQHTNEIIDYDKYENRSTQMVESINKNPIWINTFDAQDFVYIWNKNDTNKLVGTLIKSKPVADFYKDFIYSHSH